MTIVLNQAKALALNWELSAPSLMSSIALVEPVATLNLFLLKKERWQTLTYPRSKGSQQVLKVHALPHAQHSGFCQGLP